MATLRVREAFACSYKGVEEVFGAGRLVDSDDPVVKGRAHLFEDVEVAASRMSGQVEQATAAPGEKRDVGPAVKKTAAKKTTSKSK